jgi:hypothetical protein
MPDTIVESAQARLLHALRALGSPERAAQEKRYQNAARGAGSLPCPGRKRSATPNAGALSPPSPTAI